MIDQRLKRLSGHRLALEERLGDRIKRRARVEEHLAGAIVGFVERRRRELGAGGPAIRGDRPGAGRPAAARLVDDPAPFDVITTKR